MADESVFGLRDLSPAHRSRRRGPGQHQAREVRRPLARDRHGPTWPRRIGIGFIVGSMMEGPIGVGAAASLVAAVGSTFVSDLDAAWWTAAQPGRRVGSCTTGRRWSCRPAEVSAIEGLV